MAYAHLLLLVLAPFLGAQEPDHSLAGKWQVRLDPAGVGQFEQWFAESIDGSEIQLPGTTDLAGLGYELDRKTMSYGVPFPDSVWPGRGAAERLDEAGHLLRRHMYIGKAWYQRVIEVPERWRNRRVKLELERVMWRSDIWIGERYYGSNDSLTTAHIYDLGFLDPGKHRLTICVDNGQVHDLGILGHAYGPETQSRWNGIVGEIKLTAKPRFYIHNIRVDAPQDPLKLRALVSLHHLADSPSEGILTLRVTHADGTKLLTTEQFSCRADGAVLDLEAWLPIQKEVKAWSELHPQLYLLTAELQSPHGRDTMQIPFGFRTIERDGRRILINGTPMFLRGTLDCAVYPNTGHPPTTVAEWREILNTIRLHGFNHVRFHTWCPPRAAFEAADELGIYLCPETPFWVDNWTSEIGLQPKLLGSNDGVTEFVRREIQRISDAYGNHPSFAFFCIGNEFGMSSDWQVVQDLVSEAKRYDWRHLHSGSTARRRVDADDFWVTHRTEKAVRGIGPPHTNWDFSDAIADLDVPVIAHETGQRPVFPNYDQLLPKFSGPLLPLNYQRLQRKLSASGLADQADDFQRASAKFQMVQYKAEHEAMLRTPEFGGYQLLMLNDFTGQSEALVGMLDPFWQSKGIISDSDVRRWNSLATPLARMDRFIWTSEQTFEAEVDLALFDLGDWVNAQPFWELRSDDGGFHVRKSFATMHPETGRLNPLGKASASLAEIHEPTALTFTVKISDEDWYEIFDDPVRGQPKNSWRIWVYPTAPSIQSSAPTPYPQTNPDDIVISRELDADTMKKLHAGAKVLLLTHGLKNPLTKQTNFAAVYWSAGWWGDAFSHLGILCDPQHAAFALFPNDGHSDWQWYDLTQNATTFLLDQAADGFRPLVQLVPDFHHPHLLGQVFETKVGAGRLLVCGYDLDHDLANRPAALQFRLSLLSYMRSNAFAPSHELNPTLLQELLTSQD